MEVGGGPSAALRRSRSPPPTPGEDDGGDPFLALLSKQHGQQQQQQQQRHLDKRRNPLVWPSASSSDFNLTELIDSVERDIWRLEQMERRGRGGGGGLNVHAVLGPSLLLAPLLPIKTEEQDDVGLAEEIKNLPGYKPSSSTSRRREGNLIRMPDIGTGWRGEMTYRRQNSTFIIQTYWRQPCQTYWRQFFRSEVLATVKADILATGVGRGNDCTKRECRHCSNTCDMRGDWGKGG